MGGEIIEKHLDDSPFATGIHNSGGTSNTLKNPGADFKSCGVQTDVLIKNTTTGEEGIITAVREDEIDALAYLLDLNGERITDLNGEYITTLFEWTYGDVYEIYLTDTEDSLISSRYVDKRFGTRTKVRLENGLFPEDVDVDEYEKNIFGPDQPQLATGG